MKVSVIALTVLTIVNASTNSTDFPVTSYQTATSGFSVNGVQIESAPNRELIIGNITLKAFNSTAEAVSAVREMFDPNDFLIVGITGYSSKQPIDWNAAKEVMKEQLIHLVQKSSRKVIISSGATNTGVPAMAYDVAHELGIRTIGIACKKPLNQSDLKLTSSLSTVFFFGDNWGSESKIFLETSEYMIGLGGGKQARVEIEKAIEMGSKVILIAGFKGAVDDIIAEPEMKSKVAMATIVKTVEDLDK